MVEQQEIELKVEETQQVAQEEEEVKSSVDWQISGSANNLDDPAQSSASEDIAEAQPQALF